MADKKHAKNAKWLYSLVMGGSTVVTDLGIQISTALSDPSKSQDIHVLRALITGAVVAAVAKIVGMIVAAWVAKKELEDADTEETPVPPTQ